jgi:hypothetical protein
MPTMVSADHFAHELRAQLNRAAKHGAIDIVINSGELYRSRLTARDACML